MNNQEINEDRVAGLLVEIASRLSPEGDSKQLVERALARGTDRIFSCDSPLGEVYVGVSEKGVRLVGRATSPEEFSRRYRERFERLLSWGTDEKTRRLAERVGAALAGQRIEVPADLSDTTPFQERVLRVVEGISRGQVRPYAWVAREAGSPKASRAVGTVMANHPLPPGHKERRHDWQLRLRRRGESRVARRGGRACRGVGRLSVPRHAYHGDLLPCHLCQRQEDKVRKPQALPLGQGSGQCRLQALRGVPSGGGRVSGANDATDAGSK